MSEDLEEWAASYRQARRPSEAFRKHVREDLLFEDLAGWGASYRQTRTASPKVRARIWAEVEQADDEPDMSVQDTSPRWGAGLALGGLVGLAALLLLGLGARVLQSSTEPEPARLEAQDQAVQGDASAGATVHEAKTQPVVERAAPKPEEPSPAPTPASVVAPEPEVEPVPAGQASKTRPSPKPEPEGPSDLESLKRLRAAKRMLDRNPKRALSMLEDHARDFPESAVALEREALWIRAACASGGHKDLAARKSAFDRRADVGAYRAAIERACP